MNRQTARGARHHRLTRFALVAAAVGTGLGAASVAAAPVAGASGGVTLKLVSHSGIGKILVNGSGMTVYVFTADSANKASCTGGCLAVWPAVTVNKGAKPKGGPGVTHLGTIPAAGGKLQVTWNKHPLYTYALDGGPGVVKGNNVKEGSGTWLAATAKAASTKATPASGTSGSSGSSGGYGY